MDKVIEILRAHVEDATVEISSDSALQGDLGFNSLELVNLIMDFEDAYGIEIPESDVLEFVTVGDIEKYLAERVS